MCVLSWIARPMLLTYLEVKVRKVTYYMHFAAGNSFHSACTSTASLQCGAGDAASSIEELKIQLRRYHRLPSYLRAISIVYSASGYNQYTHPV